MSDLFLSYLREQDISIFQAINGFCGQNPSFDRHILKIDFSALKGLAFMGTFGALWFQRAKDQARRREALII